LSGHVEICNGGQTTATADVVVVVDVAVVCDSCCFYCFRSCCWAYQAHNEQEQQQLLAT